MANSDESVNQIFDGFNFEPIFDKAFSDPFFSEALPNDFTGFPDFGAAPLFNEYSNYTSGTTLVNETDHSYSKKIQYDKEKTIHHNKNGVNHSKNTADTTITTIVSSSTKNNAATLPNSNGKDNKVSTVVNNNNGTTTTTTTTTGNVIK